MHCPNCRVALAPNSRFCNTCGAAATPGAAPGVDRTMAYSGQTMHGRPQPTQQSMPPTYQVPSGMPPPGAYHAAPLPQPSKKPIALLVAVMLLIGGGVLAGGFMMFKKSQNAVTGGQMAANPTAPGLQQAPSAVTPSAPGVVTAPSRPTVPGQPVTAGPQTPNDGMAPSVVMAPGSTPQSAPSVAVVPGVQSPTAPPVTTAPQQPNRPQAPVTGAPTQAQAPPQPQAPPDNADFDRYLRWLQYVENERATLRAQGETESFRMIDNFYQAALGLADPDTNDAILQQQFDRNIQVTLQRTVGAIRLFRQNVVNSKRSVPVPPDCRALDQHYMSALEQEGVATAALLEALTRKDIGRIKQIGRSGTGNIDRSLGMANNKLEQVYRSRGLNQQFRIETGGGSSMLGGMMGLGGL